MQSHALPPDQCCADGFATPTAKPRPLRPAGGIKGGALSGAALVLLFLLTACAPNLGDKPVPQDPAGLATAESFKAPAADWPKQDWWKAYGDPQLDALIDEALKDSPTLKIAAARVRAAEAEAGTAEADLWPTLNASGSLQEYEMSRNQMGTKLSAGLPKGWHHMASLSAGMSYELDFFGKNRAALAAATSAAEAAQYDEAEARLQLSTAVATVYADLAQLYAEADLAAEAVRQRTESAELVRQRFQHSLENQGTLAEAEAQVSAAETQADIVKRLIANTRNQLAALLGKGPDRGLTIAPPADAAILKPAGLPPHLAVELVGRRPDIMAARKRAQAASSAIDVANANFYPNVDLVGNFGVLSLDAKDLLTAGSEMGSFGPAVTLPLFDYGRLTGLYSKARADYDAAVAAYDVTLTNALRDVANAYTNRRSADTELMHARQTLASASQAYFVLKARYGKGLARYIDVLSAETSLIQQRRTVADLEANAFASDVALVRALGGAVLSKN